MIELFKDGVGHNWRKVLRAAGYDDKTITRQGLWDLMNPTKLVCSCGAERPVRKTAIGRLETCGSTPCRNKLKRDRTTATSIAKYGTPRPAQSAAVKQKQADTFASRFGGHPAKTAEVQAKRLSTNLEKYGTATPAIEASRLASSVKKRQKTELAKYIKDVWPGRVQYFKEHLGIEVLSAFSSVKGELTCRHTCGAVWTAVPTPVPRCPMCSASREQQGVDLFIDSLGLEYVRNTRKIIPPYEIDLYFPDLKVGIELNGMYWHRENAGTPIARKTELAAKEGVRLMHISDHDWNAHKDIVQSHIRHMVGCTTSKVPARKCQVKVINSRVSRQFLEATHLQGAANAKHHFGLFYGEMLVAVMTLGAPRWGNKSRLELIRWSTALDTNVQGGFTKVLQFATDLLGAPEILSYCDLRTGTGSVYKAAGFVLDGITKPGYVWIRGREVLHRHATQKHKLQEVLGSKFNSALSERENMEAAGWARVFDAGNQRWILESNPVK